VLQRLGLIDDVNTVKHDVTQTSAERHEVAEVDFAVRSADEYVTVDVQLTDISIIINIIVSALTNTFSVKNRINTSNNFKNSAKC